MRWWIVAGLWVFAAVLGWPEIRKWSIWAWDSLMDYWNGIDDVAPIEPTPVELRVDSNDGEFHDPSDIDLESCIVCHEKIDLEDVLGLCEGCKETLKKGIVDKHRSKQNGGKGR